MEESSDDKADASQDPLYLALKDIAQQEGRVSIPLTQRRLGIGFNRAMRLLDQLERDGLIDSHYRWIGK